MNLHAEAAPVEEEKFLTPGVMVLLALMGVGLAFVAARFLFGIGKVANLNNQFPWGIWIGIDVASGVALAAGGVAKQEQAEAGAAAASEDQRARR